jgi:spoIIIJ-associated protein
VQAEIHGQDLDILIGRRAETLQALQYLVSLIVGKEIEDWVHVVLDVEGYRQRREQQLRRLAARVAEQAIRTGRRQVLEPMPAAERRIIHLALRNHPDVTTQSIGEEPNRKVVIIPRR